MDKKILFVVYQAPVGAIWVNEAFRTAFGMYGEDIEPAVLLMQEASIALSAETKPERLGLLPISVVHRFIKKYDTAVYGIKEDIENYDVTNIDPAYAATLLSREKLADFFHSFNSVIFM